MAFIVGRSVERLERGMKETPARGREMRGKRGKKSGRSAFEPGSRAASVRIESFDFAEMFDRGDGFLGATAVEFYRGRWAVEHVGLEGGEGAPGAAGGQRVARARDEISRRHRRP